MLVENNTSLFTCFLPVAEMNILCIPRWLSKGIDFTGHVVVSPQGA